jgi:riboflavin synthase
MFTGLVERMGRASVTDAGGMARISVDVGNLSGGVEIGDSVAVNGVCLTVNELADESLVFLAMPETLRRTALGGLRDGAPVNLELAMRADARFGGHIVQGHVDGVGRVRSVTPEGDAELWEFTAPAAVLRYTVEKGSVCVDGISLTVAALGEDGFTVSVLPQTREKTNLKALQVGDRVNLEADVIGKYVERMLGPRLGQATEQDKDRSVRDAV